MTTYTAAWAAWIAFVVSWWLAAAWRARAVRGNSRGSRAVDYLLYAAAFALLFLPPRLSPRLWPPPAAVGWALVGVELAAFGFAWWARLHLGRLWSGMIVLREGHRVVDTGPYRLVRHPIYTGFIAAAWALALVEMRVGPLAGAAALTAVMAWKARREERFLRTELGAAAYDGYAARTPMLVPFAPVRRG